MVLGLLNGRMLPDRAMRVNPSVCRYRLIEGGVMQNPYIVVGQNGRLIIWGESHPA